MTWRSPSELVTLGFQRAPLVMMNEGHNGMKRCVRTRRIGREILPAAHAAGCRALAMEALVNTAAGPTTYDGAPPRIGYLEQPEMWDLVEAAVALGWKLVAYECSAGLAPPELFGTTDETRYRGIAFTNWREAQQAEAILAAHAEHGPLLVWCGNAHHRKRPGTEWIPMGSVLAAKAEAFCIDQLATVSLGGDDTPAYALTPELAASLAPFDGTAGFLVEETPPGMRVITGFDAAILSTDNAVS